MSGIEKNFENKKTVECFRVIIEHSKKKNTTKIVQLVDPCVKLFDEAKR